MYFSNTPFIGFHDVNILTTWKKYSYNYASVFLGFATKLIQNIQNLKFWVTRLSSRQNLWTPPKF